MVCGIVKTADGFMAMWHRAEVKRNANEDAETKGDSNEEGGGEGGGVEAHILRCVEVRNRFSEKLLA